MARANVYNKNTKKKNMPVIISSIVGSVILVAAIILVSLWACGVFNQKPNHNYFSDYENLKINELTTLDNIIEKDKQDEKHTFVFVYNNETFDISENETDKVIYERVIELANAVASKKVGPENAFHLYLVDSSKEGNGGIIGNQAYGNITEGSALIYFFRGVQYNETPEALEHQFPEDLENPKHVYRLSVSNDQQLLKNKLPEAISYVKEIYSHTENEGN